MCSTIVLDSILETMVRQTTGKKIASQRRLWRKVTKLGVLVVKTDRTKVYSNETNIPPNGSSCTCMNRKFKVKM